MKFAFIRLFMAKPIFILLKNIRDNRMSELLCSMRKTAFFGGKKRREQKGERKKDRDTQTDRKSNTQTDRQKDGQTDRRRCSLRGFLDASLHLYKPLYLWVGDA